MLPVPVTLPTLNSLDTKSARLSVPPLKLRVPSIIPFSSTNNEPLIFVTPEPYKCLFIVPEAKKVPLLVTVFCMAKGEKLEVNVPPSSIIKFEFIILLLVFLTFPVICTKPLP